ncbi:periodic tryptophan protein 1 homolog [Planococcus citri]|uniref:periodic tryptophan protein 1 homolog n=1 Tax=Planococcus citri TaxID=170843 RepID=UPI0031F8C169
MNFVSCVKWIKQGVAKREPDNVHLTEEELREIVEQKSDEEDESGKPSKPTSSDDEYDFKNYDNEDELRVSIKGIATFDADKKKKKKKKKNEKEKKRKRDDSDDSEKEDELIKEDDNLLIVGHVDDDYNTLDVYVYNENDGDMYIHHDMVLKSPALCVEWLNIPGASETSNVCAIGSMKPIVEIWDLDIINSVAPVFRLGRRKKKNPEKNYGHTDAVLSLAWNTELTHILCSGGVDNRVLMWDLDDGKVATEINSFSDKVQNLAWNPHNANFLLTGCADGVLRNYDCRVYDEFKEINLDSPIESMFWDVTNEHRCFIGTEDGQIRHLDWRKKKKPIHQFQAHSKEVTGLCVDPNHPDVLVSISTDECMKLWDTSNEYNMITMKDLKLGGLHCIDLNPDFPYLAAVGGMSEKRGKTVLKVVSLEESTKPENVSNDEFSE